MLSIKLPVPTRNRLYLTETVNFCYPYLYNIDSYQVMNCTIYKSMLQLINSLVMPDIKTYISGSYEIKTNEKGVFSLSLIGLGDFKGAHPMTIINSLSFDTETGKNYKLSELFKPNSNYIKVLSEKVLIQLKAQNLPLFDEYPGIKPDQDYYIADKSLVIYFQLYEVAPYYVGFPYAIIPIYEIQDMIVENGLLSKMLS